MEDLSLLTPVKIHIKTPIKKRKHGELLRQLHLDNILFEDNENPLSKKGKKKTRRIVTITRCFLRRLKSGRFLLSQQPQLRHCIASTTQHLLLTMQSLPLTKAQTGSSKVCCRQFRKMELVKQSKSSENDCRLCKENER